MRYWLVLLLSSTLFTSCSLLVPNTAPRENSKDLHPADFPYAIYRAAKTGQNNRVYQLDGRASEIRIKVFRGGVMAALGHDHIVASRHVKGFIQLNPVEVSCRADFYLPLDQLVVDDPDLRAGANLQTTPSAEDIKATRRNMLINLEAAEYPFIQLSSDSCGTLLKGEAVEVTITLHGVSRKQTINLNLDRDGSEKLVVKGDFSLLQSDFGIQPFSLLNGLLRVKDRLEISVELKARAL